MRNKKAVQIKILGHAGCGKSLVAQIISEALEKNNIKVVSFSDPDYVPHTEEWIKKITAANADSFEISIETVQLNRSFLNV